MVIANGSLRRLDSMNDRNPVIVIPSTARGLLTFNNPRLQHDHVIPTKEEQLRMQRTSPDIPSLSFLNASHSSVFLSFRA